MTDLMITNRTDTALEVTNGKQTAFVCTYRNTKGISVTCLNASHRVWRGAGRTFWSWEEARNGYKSAFMKSVVDLAQSELAAA